MTKSYHLNNIKTLLNQGFTEEELRDFCFFEPEFRSIYDQLPQTSGKKQTIIRQLIGHATQKGLLVSLLEWVEKTNPAAYGRYQPYYTAVSGAGLAHIEPIDVHFVVAAMTHREAKALVTGTAFDDPTVADDERKQFQAFRASLPEHNINDLLPYYRESRDDWTPPFHAGQTIKETISEIVERVNEACAELWGASKIRPQFISANFFSQTRETRLHTWQSTESGCIIVADSVSLFHPWIYKMLLQSEMSSREEVALLVLSPVNFSQIPINQLIEKKIMERALTRFSGELKRLSEFGAGDLHILRRWLFATLPEVVNMQKQANPVNRAVLREKMGKEPRGMGPLNW